MFPTKTTAFSAAFCPGLLADSQCLQLNCLFSHTPPPEKHGVKRESSQAAGVKRQKIESVKGTGPAKGSESVKGAKPAQNSVRTRKPNEEADRASDSSGARKPASESIPAQAGRAPVPASAPGAGQGMKLLPRQVLPYGPATIPQRSAYLKAIHGALVGKQVQNPVQRAIEAEYETARASTKVSYPVNIRQLVSKIRTGVHDILSTTASASDSAPASSSASPSVPRATPSSSSASSSSSSTAPSSVVPPVATKSHIQIAKQTPADLHDELEKLVLPMKMLVKWGFVTEPSKSPRPFDINLNTSCARCQTEFTVSDKKPVSCRYHPLKPVFEYDYEATRKIKRYPCCPESTQDSAGCEIAPQHVFKLEGAESLAGIIPFVATPAKKSAKTLFAAGLDCEMAYTSFGVELIRVTIIDWDTRIPLLDRLVHPYGEVYDFNSRFSGVHSLADGTKDPTDPTGTRILPAVTFKEVRDLIFEYVSASTILIGHGFENDLNAMRLIHHRVIDTALMYPRYDPHHRLALRTLTFRYLGRNIQSGEHDSSEDALAAMDIIIENIKRDKLKGTIKA